MRATSHVIRPAQQGDRIAVTAIAEAAYALYLDRMDKKPFPMLDDYAGHIEQGRAHVLEDEGEVRGFVVLLDEANALLLDNIAVHPASQGQGYGHILARFAEKEALRRGYDRIHLYTNEVMTENLAWYQRLGYTVYDRIMEKGYRRIYMEKQL